MLTGLLGGRGATAAEVERFTSHDDRSVQYSWGAHVYRGSYDRWRPQDPWGYHPPWAGLGYGLPNRFTIYIRRGSLSRRERVRVRVAGH
jgi:hypothetical protein